MIGGIGASFPAGVGPAPGKGHAVVRRIHGSEGNFPALRSGPGEASGRTAVGGGSATEGPAVPSLIPCDTGALVGTLHVSRPTRARSSHAALASDERLIDIDRSASMFERGDCQR